MFEALKYQMWELRDQTAYKTETQELQRVYGATFLIEREHAREEGREEGRIDLLAKLVQRQQLSFQVAAEYLDEKQTAQLKELVSAEQQETATTAVQPPAEPDSTTS